MGLYRKGELDAAVGAFHSAREAYAQEGREDKAAEMSNAVCVALIQAGRPQDALEAVRGTPATFARMADTGREGKALGNLAAALEACGNLVEAETLYSQALDRLRRAGDRESEAGTLAALSKLQLRRGQPLVALASMQASLETAQRRSPAKRLLRRLLHLPFKLIGMPPH